MPRRRVPERPPVVVRTFASADIERGIAKLRRRIEEVAALDPTRIAYSDASVRTAERNTRGTIRELFGEQSPEFADHRHVEIWHGGINLADTPHDRQGKFAAGVPQTVKMIEGLISRLEEKRHELGHPVGGSGRAPVAGDEGTRSVFVVHGRDEAAKEMVARFLAQLDLEPVILHEQANEGKTLIEKFETHAKVPFAVVLLTPDDVGAPRDDPSATSPRARQNVVFELGYFIGRLGRGFVCALYKGEIELPSDFAGVVYVPMDAPGAWRLLLARELRAAQIDVDLNRAI